MYSILIWYICIDIFEGYEYNISEEMIFMLKTRQTIKYTATLPETSVDELKMLAEKKVIPSVNFAIREAIDIYITQRKKELYEKQMQEAAQDKIFLKRTIDSNKDFFFVDSEVRGDW